MLSPRGGAGSAVAGCTVKQSELVAGASSGMVEGVTVDTDRGVRVRTCKGARGVASRWRPSYAPVPFGFVVIVATAASGESRAVPREPSTWRAV